MFKKAKKEYVKLNTKIFLKTYESRDTIFKIWDTFLVCTNVLFDLSLLSMIIWLLIDKPNVWRLIILVHLSGMIYTLRNQSIKEYIITPIKKELTKKI